MKMILAIIIGLSSASPVFAEYCECNRTTEVCVCRAGECQCPNCPGRKVAAMQYPVAAVYAVPVYVVQVAPVQQSSGCYQDNRGNWICPNQRLSGGQKRAIRKMQRKGVIR